MPNTEKKSAEFGYRTTQSKKAAVEEAFPIYAKIVDEKKGIEDLDLSKFRRKTDEEFVRMVKAGNPPDYPPRFQPMPEVGQTPRRKRQKPK